MLTLYRLAGKAGTPVLRRLLARRATRGKEDPARLGERRGIASLPRPEGKLIWLHAASVGEAQSALSLIHTLQNDYPDIFILVTTGTVTSATLMAERLDGTRAFHQYAPLDQINWVRRFLDYWHPALALRIESEIWPNAFLSLKERGIPLVLLNARLSPKSIKGWQRVPDKTRLEIFTSISHVLAQNEAQADQYEALGCVSASSGGNLKYAAAPLPFDASHLKTLQEATKGRKIWLYASTHSGEEMLAADTHLALRKKIPGLLTIIVPRHPERGEDIEADLRRPDLNLTRRGADMRLPLADTDIYIADTLGELGLFYRLSPVACIGRSFSADGGGGHNPIEAAQLDTAILYGPYIQNWQAVYDDMWIAGAVKRVNAPENLPEALWKALEHPEDLQKKAKDFAEAQTGALENAIAALKPYLESV